MNVIDVLNTAYNSLLQHGIPKENIHWMDNIPPLNQITDQYFMSELSWCIYNAGMKESVVRQKWPYIMDAFFYFANLNDILENEIYIIQNAQRHQEG